MQSKSLSSNLKQVSLNREVEEAHKRREEALRKLARTQTSSKPVLNTMQKPLISSRTRIPWRRQSTQSGS